MKIKHLPKDFGIDNPKDPLKTDGADRIMYKQYVSLFKKNITKLINLIKDPVEGEEIDKDKGVHFFVLLNHHYPDKEKLDLPYILLGTPKGDWRAFMKESLKKNKKMVARGFAKLKDDNAKLELDIEQGMARPKQIKKLLDKYLFKFVGPEISFPEEVIEEVTVDVGDGAKTTVELEKDMAEAEKMIAADDKISKAFNRFVNSFKEDSDELKFQPSKQEAKDIAAEISDSKKLHRKLELAINKWLEKIITGLGLDEDLSLENVDVKLANQKKELLEQAKRYLTYLSKLDKISYGDDGSVQEKLVKHAEVELSVIKEDAERVNGTIKANMTTEEFLYQEAYVKGLWSKVNNGIREKILAAEEKGLDKLKGFREEIAKKFPSVVDLNLAIAKDPQKVELPKLDRAKIGALTEMEKTVPVLPNHRALNDIIKLLKQLDGAQNEAQKLSLLESINAKINDYLVKYSKDNDGDVVKRLAALRSLQKDFKTGDAKKKEEEKQQEIDKNIGGIDFEGSRGKFNDLKSWREPSFGKLYDLFEEIRKSDAPSIELIQHLNRLIKEWMHENPKDKKRCAFLIEMQDQWKDKLGEDLEDKEMANNTFVVGSLNLTAPLPFVGRTGADFRETKLMEGTVAGSAASSEKAKEIRDAKVSDRAMRLAALLSMGKAKPTDKLFGAVAKWLFDSIENNLEKEYDTACQQIYDGQGSSLMADILSVFAGMKLQNRYLLDRLRGVTHPLVPLAMKLGVMGDDSSIFSLFGGKQEAKDAIDEVLKSLTKTQIDTILNAKESDNTYEGAILKKLSGFGSGLEPLKKQMAKQSEILGLKEKDPVDETKLNKVNNEFLLTMVDRLQNEHLVAEEGVLKKVGNWMSKATALWNGSGGRVDPDKLINEVLAWAEGASEKEREAILKGDFMKKLEELAKATSLSGLKESHLKYLKKRLAVPKRDPNTEATDKLFDELGAIAEQQGERSYLDRRSNKEVVLENFKSILQLENGNPQAALIKRFTMINPNDSQSVKTRKEEILKEWNKASNDLGLATDAKVREEALAAQGKALNKVMGNLRSMMDTAKVDKEDQSALEEAIFSNGGRGFIYQELSDLATGRRPRYDLGTTVLDLLEKVDVSSVEFATIKNDTTLLSALKNRILGFMESDDNTTKWKSICKILGVDHNIPKGEAVSILRKAREGNITRHKMLDPKEQKKKQEEAKEREKTPEYWAAKISKEYRTTNNEQQLMMLVYKAQQKVGDITDVFTCLEGGNEIEAIDPDAYKRLFSETSDHAKEVLDDIRNTGRKLKAKEVMEATTSSVEVFSQNSVLLGLRNIFRTTDEGEVKELVEAMPPQEIMESFFDLNELRLLKKPLAEKKAAGEDKEKLKVANQKIQAILDRFDVNKTTLLDLDAMMKPKDALVVKKMMRNKLGEALAKKDNSFDALLKDQPVNLSDEEIQLLKEDFPILSGKIKAISNIETSEQSETGTQWSSVSSKMGQRDIAEADYLGKLWENNESLESLASLSPEDVEKEKLAMAESLADVEGVLTDAIASFEERKGQYDQRIQDFIATFMASIIAGISIASGVGAAAGIVQLMWAMFTPIVKNAITQVVTKVTKGDRADAIGFKENMQEWFFNTLADQAGAAMGMVGANLTFALDVKMIGTLTSGGKNSGWTAWDSIMKSPVLKVAKGYIGKTFDNIGRSFVEMGTKKTKGSSATDAVNELEAFGKRTLTQLGTAYLKALVMTTFTAGANELAGALGWEEAKWRNTGMAGNNLNTTGDDPRGFNSGDANFMSVDEMKENGNNFTSFVNSLGMFDASPKLVDGTAADSSLANGDAWDFIKIPGEAIQNLAKPQYLATVVNNFAWGGSEFKGEGVGISHILGSTVDSALASFKKIEPKEKDKLVAKLEKELQDEVKKQLEAKRAYILETISDHGGKIPNFSDLTEADVKAWDLLEKGKEIMFVWENMDCKNPANIRQAAQANLGLDDGQYELFSSKIEGVNNAKSLRDIMNIYYELDASSKSILNNSKFIKAYAMTQGFSKGEGIEEDKFKIGKDITASVDLLIPADKKLSELSMGELYDQWQKWTQAKGEESTYSLEALVADLSKKGVNNKVIQNLIGTIKKKDEELFNFYFEYQNNPKAMVEEGMKASKLNKEARDTFIQKIKKKDEELFNYYFEAPNKVNTIFTKKPEIVSFLKSDRAKDFYNDIDEMDADYGLDQL